MAASLLQEMVDTAIITNADAKRVKLYQALNGGRVKDIVLGLSLASRRQVYSTISRRLALPFLYTADQLEKTKGEIDRAVVTRISLHEKFSRQIIPYRIDKQTLCVLTSEPNNLETHAYLTEMYRVTNIAETVVDDHNFKKLFIDFFNRRLESDIKDLLLYRDREESAFKTFYPRQVLFFTLLLLITAVSIYFHPVLSLKMIVTTVQVLFFLLVSYKFLLVVLGADEQVILEHDEQQLTSLSNKELPLYTIIVPLYHEANIAEKLIGNLKKLDYPVDRLEVLLLVESDDSLTGSQLLAAGLPQNWSVLTVPNSQPKTKPKACNYGLFLSRGRYIVIFDAEDRPEPLQLKKAYLAFKEHDRRHICFQAALNYYNQDQNFLTRMFTLEYSYWFDYMLPGLFRLRLPIPLGGTSNHFRDDTLQQIGGWDPYNTTEDADLGIRAAAEGFKIGIINSTTWEEANSKTGNWLRQRSRWIKGYMQTALVYNRHPLKNITGLGVGNWLSFQFFVTGTPLVFLINPWLWILFLLWLSGQFNIINTVFSGLTQTIALFNLITGNFLVIYANMIGAFKRHNYRLVIFAIFNPLYWTLHSLAAYKALWQLIVKPHYWEKTEHGLADD